MPHRAEPLPLLSTPRTVPDSRGAVTRRTFAYGGLALLLGGGLAARFGASMPVGGPVVDRDHHQLAQLASLSPAEAEAALATSTIPPEQRPGILAAVRARRMHLVEVPFFGVGATVGRAVTVSCGLVSVPLVLAAAPLTVLLPITRAATIMVTSADRGIGADEQIGMITTLGARALAAPDGDNPLQIDVIVQ